LLYRYHDEGLCELGPKCPLIHEKRSVSFDPSAPEFHPAQKSNNISAIWNESNNSESISALWNGESSSHHSGVSNSVNAVANPKDGGLSSDSPGLSGNRGKNTWSYESDIADLTQDGAKRVLAKDLTALALQGIVTGEGQ